MEFCRFRDFAVPLLGLSTRHPSIMRCAQPSWWIQIFDYALHSSYSHDAVIPVYDAASNMIKTHEHKDDFKRW
jgi:hypothetical protein